MGGRRDGAGGREVGRRHRKWKGPVTPGWKLGSIYRPLPLEAEKTRSRGGGRTTTRSRGRGPVGARAGGGFGNSERPVLGDLPKPRCAAETVLQPLQSSPTDRNHSQVGEGGSVMVSLSVHKWTIAEVPCATAITVFSGQNNRFDENENETAMYGVQEGNITAPSRTSVVMNE